MTSAIRIHDMNRTVRTGALSFALALLASACTPTPPAAKDAGTATVSQFLVFGDTGYDYPFLDAEDIAEALPREQFLAGEKQSWLEDGKAPEDYKDPPLHTLENGTVVDATGLHGVSGAMHDFCATVAPCRYAVMLGDNIYPSGATLGTDGIPDARRYEELFMKPLGTLGGADRAFRIYTVLGNHDWYTSRAGALDQVRFLETHPPFYMDGLRYAARPPSAGGEVEIFALDTHVLLAGTGVRDGMLNADGSEVRHDTPEEYDPWTRPATEAERTMVQWLERSLRESPARWKIVIAHHPLWSSGGTKFEQGHMLRRLLLPSLCRYADLYLAGHEHTLEVHTDDCSTVLPDSDAPPLVQIVSGAAAKQRGVHRNFMAHQDRNYPEHKSLFARGMLWGFAHVTLQAEAGEVRLLATPDDGSTTHAEIFRTGFARRSGAAAH